mmetsp:Transcript_42127/g.99893  ORF Transcript_42127/g.99893 Transcript_42127/m.99893 type:complete len:200 (+) Transcript_42127:1863-2462(+)
MMGRRPRAASTSSGRETCTTLVFRSSAGLILTGFLSASARSSPSRETSGSPICARAACTAARMASGLMKASAASTPRSWLASSSGSPSEASEGAVPSLPPPSLLPPLSPPSSAPAPSEPSCTTASSSLTSRSRSRWESSPGSRRPARWILSARESPSRLVSRWPRLESGRRRASCSCGTSQLDSVASTFDRASLSSFAS